TDLEVAGHCRGELLGVLGEIWMEVDGGRMLQGFVLLASRLDDVRVAMADTDRYDTAEAVEIALAGVVPDVLHFAFHQHQRLFVVKEDAGIDELLSQGENLVGGRAGIRLGLMGSSGQSWRGHNLVKIKS